MPQITSIEPQKKKPDRFNIFVDGEFSFGLDAEALVKSGLKVGQEISEEGIGKLVVENETNKLVEKALRFLSFRPRSEREVRDHLRKKVSRSQGVKVSRNTIDTVIKKLQRLNYLNDLEFSKWWIEQRQTHKPCGVRLIRNELYQKNIDREVVDQVLGESGNREAEIELATKAAKKKLKSYEKLGPQEFRQKMGQFLARRGFGWETIKDVISALG